MSGASLYDAIRRPASSIFLHPASSHHPRFAMKHQEIDAIAMLGSEHEIDAIAACSETLVAGRRIVEMKVSHSSRGRQRADGRRGHGASRSFVRTGGQDDHRAATRPAVRWVDAGSAPPGAAPALVPLVHSALGLPLARECLTSARSIASSTATSAQSLIARLSSIATLRSRSKVLDDNRIESFRSRFSGPFVMHVVSDS